MTGLTEILSSTKKSFETYNKANGDLVNFAKECEFARQQILKNDYITTIAANNTDSLKNAIRNVGAIGITLNPARQLAYLVPRDNQIVLDISYRGLIKLATDSGVIKWARPQVVYTKDKFIYLGPVEKPEFSYNPLEGDRGEFAGVFCIAKTNEGDFMTGYMTATEIYEVRETSKAYKSGKKNPWDDWFEEMAKKTIIKRESKTWPQSDGRDLLDKAVDVLNEHEGIDITVESYFDVGNYNKFKALIKDDKPLEFYLLSKMVSVEEYTAMCAGYIDTAPKNSRGLWKEIISTIEKKGNSLFVDCSVQLDDYIDSEDETGVAEIMQEYSVQEASVFINSSEKLRVFLEKNPLQLTHEGVTE